MFDLGFSKKTSQRKDSFVSDESVCRRCGKCCYRKIIIGNTVHTTPFPCEFLDEQTMLCRVYERRKELKKNCLSVRDGMKVSAFPADCAYVPCCAPVGYKPARTDWDWGRCWTDFDEIADTLGVSAAIREAVRARGPQACLPWLRDTSDHEGEEKQ
jgi:hypothetical protein